MVLCLMRLMVMVVLVPGVVEPQHRLLKVFVVFVAKDLDGLDSIPVW